MYLFLTSTRTARDRHRAFRHAECLCDHHNQLIVRRAVHGRRVETYEQRIAARSRDAGSSGAWNDANADDDSTGNGFDHVR